ncbi:MAG: hypothetical protein CM1200mP20_15070 [Pseudomonadota bacterium]|nr:MAG: hypothetical protein CM1200mP20_15070 [Pseudomonadota bacterium]
MPPSAADQGCGFGENGIGWVATQVLKTPGRSSMPGDQVRYIGPIGAGTVRSWVHNARVSHSDGMAEVFSVGVKAVWNLWLCSRLSVRVYGGGSGPSTACQNTI